MSAGVFSLDRSRAKVQGNHNGVSFCSAVDNRLPDIHWGPHCGVFRLELLQVEGNCTT